MAPKAITEEHPALRLQRTFGNQAVLRMLRSQEQDTRRAGIGARASRSQQQAKRNVSQADHMREVATKGVAGPATSLPHLDAIQRSFGNHDVSGVEVHTGPQATDSNHALGAVGYTIGNHVAFAGTPDLHTAAHEAAHVVQQRGGVQLSGGLGQAGDAYERHADAVADGVVKGKQVGALLNQMPGLSGDGHASGTQTRDQPVQMQGGPNKSQNQKMATGDPTTDLLQKAFQQAFQKSLQQYFQTDEIKKPIVEKLATDYLNRPGKLEISARAVPNSPYVIPGVHDPSYNEVYIAIYNAIDIDELVKGKWNWRDATVKKKTRDEKLGEIGAFATQEFIQGKLQGAVVKTAVSWATKESVLVTATFTLAEAAAATAATLFAIELIGIATLALGLYELANSINAPAELSPYQEKNANIVASVKAWLQKKQEAADLKERLNKPFKVETTPAVRSTTRIGP